MKARLDHDIEIASKIQQGLLPKELPNLPDVAVAGSTLACYSVGGDCFDVIDLDGGRHGFFSAIFPEKGFRRLCSQRYSREFSTPRLLWTSRLRRSFHA